MFKNISKKRLTILLVSLLSVVAISVGVTLAYVFTRTDEVENEFKPSKVACAVVEDGRDPASSGQATNVSTKSNVQIQNTGDTDAYIRVAVVVTWKSEADGATVYAQMPVVGTDYTDWTPGADWIKVGDYYYYTKSVAPTETTGTLIDEIKVLDNANVPDGYYLSVEIVASAIQAKPTDVVKDQWGVTVGNDGSITTN